VLFVVADEASVSVSPGRELQAIQRIARETVDEVRLRLAYSPQRDAVRGAAFGGAAFGAIGVLLCRAFGGSASCARGVARAGGIGAGFGAALSLTAGAVKHAIKPNTRVLYRAPRAIAGA
jgi:hypothetical protein